MAWRANSVPGDRETAGQDDQDSAQVISFQCVACNSVTETEPLYSMAGSDCSAEPDQALLDDVGVKRAVVAIEYSDPVSFLAALVNLVSAEIGVRTVGSQNP